MLADCVHSEGPESHSSMLQANIVNSRIAVSAQGRGCYQIKTVRIFGVHLLYES